MTTGLHLAFEADLAELGDRMVDVALFHRSLPPQNGHLLGTTVELPTERLHFSQRKGRVLPSRRRTAPRVE